MDFPYEKDSKERLPYEHYIKIYQSMKPEDMASRANIPYDAEKRLFTIRLMGVTYQVSWPEYEARHLDREDIGYYPLEDAANARILVLRYLTEGAAAPATGKFLTYREIPWGEVYFKQFQGRCIFRLAFGFGNKLEKFKEIMDNIGAAPISNGDAGYEFEFLNDLYLRFLLWEGDEEFPPSAQILFSDNFPLAFVQGEDMAVVGGVSIGVLKAMSK